MTTLHNYLAESDELATAIARQARTERGDDFYWPTVSGAALGTLLSVYDAVERARQAMLNGDGDLVRMFIEEAARTDPRTKNKEGKTA